MTKRTPHGERRHTGADRPTREAAGDRATTGEIYLDADTGHYVFVGARGRTHVFTDDGRHYTSFRTTQANRAGRVAEGKWERVEREELPDGLR